MRPKHIPTRTCIACRAARAKRELIRVVRTPAGEIVADATGRRPGRGAYLDADPACLERGFAAGALARALETEIPKDVRARLRDEMAAIARERPARDLRSLAAERSGAAGAPVREAPPGSV